ncbi:hypothetical protein T439DRAFT_378137 [Meredithblackwellia eburnea MCA 4105]
MLPTSVISSPTTLIQELYIKNNKNLDGFESRVENTFNALFKDNATRQQVPALSSTSTQSTIPKLGSLVRFRAMIQDTTIGQEVYKALGTKDNVLMYGMEEEQEADSELATAEDYGNLKEREVLYVVSVPGETDWVKQALDGEQAALESATAALSLTNTNLNLANKYPVTGEQHFGCVAKIYGDLDESMKAGEVFEFFGVLGEASLSSSFDDLATGDALETIVPAIHVLFTTRGEPAVPPFEASGPVDELRSQLLGYLASTVGGDTDAAEWILLALLSRIHTRNASGATLGSLSLNLALPAGLTSTLSTVLPTLVPKSTSLQLSIPFLNNVKTRIAPRSRDEFLESGALQLSPGTSVLVDARGIGEGKLEDAGVRNLQYIASAVASQKVAYQFPYSAFELDADLGFIVLSEGKALIPTDCVVYVKPTATSDSPTPTPEQLSSFRSFLSTQKNVKYEPLDPDVSEVIQNDFVERRQNSVAGQGMTQDDLLFRLGTSRLLALSLGKTGVDKETWLRLAELDERRKDRQPAVKKA